VQRLEESSSWPRPTAVLTQRSGPHEMSARAANGGVRRAGSARRRRSWPRDQTLTT
jgi:hypothetical protein